jgi:uncharacterized membrane protein YphA (DoxX/SURF4 family)
MQKLQQYSPVILRVGIAVVFLWFGAQQLLHPGAWIGFIPKMLVSVTGLSKELFVAFNGSFEIVFGLCLLLGYYTRTTALLLALHMLDITLVVGYSATGVRDFGLSIAAIAVFMYGADLLTLDARKERKMV